MPNDLMPDTSSYADPSGNALLAKGYDGNAATQSTIATLQGAQGLQMNQQVMQLRAAQIGQEQLTLGRQKLTALNGVLGGLVTNPTADNATNQIGWAVQNGVIDPQSATKAAGEIAALGGDPQKIKAWATDHLNQNAQHQQLMDQAYGTPGLVDNGSTLTPTMTKQGAAGGISPAAGPIITKQLSPEVATAPQTGPVNPDGSPTQDTRAGAVARQGGLPATVDIFGRIAYPGRAAPTASPASPAPAAPASGQGGAQPPAPAGSAPAATWTPTSQTVPLVTDDMFAAARARITGGQGTAADRNVLRGYAVQHNMPLPDKGGAFEPQPGQAPQSTASGQGGAPASPVPAPNGSVVPPGRQPPAPVQAPGAASPYGAAPGPITVGLAPGAATSADQNAMANAAQGQALQRAADAVPQNKATIANLESDLNSISTGPLASKINVAKSTYNQVAGMAGLPQVDPGGVAKMEQFHKNAAILAGQQFAALGGTGTDQQLGAAISANPSEALSTMGNKAILSMLKGNQDAIAAKNTAWQNRPSGQSYGQFAEDWNRSFSPRAFQMVYMSPADRKETMASMSPQERQAVTGAIQTAVQRGWIDPSKVAR